MSRISDILKELRYEKNIYQKDIAKKLNIETNTYGAWERGNTEPPIDMLIILANFFNVSVDYLIGNENEDYTKVNNSNNNLSIEEQRLIQNYKLLDDRKKRLVDYYVEAMLDIENKENKLLK